MFKSKFGGGGAQTRPTRSKGGGDDDVGATSPPTSSGAQGGGGGGSKQEQGASKSGWTKIEKWGRGGWLLLWAAISISHIFVLAAVHQYKGQAGTKELSFAKGDEFKLFAEAQGWYKAYKLPLDNKESGM